MVIPILQKFLPMVNFVVASAALGFQVSVLHPWHNQLDKDLSGLQHKQETKLHEYEQLRMHNIKNIEEYLVKLNIDRSEEQ